MTSENSLHPGFMFKKRWKVAQIIGRGGFGEVYRGFDFVTRENVAIKVESTGRAKQVLKMDVLVLKKLQGRDHICRFFGCGCNGTFNYVVMQLQGRNLVELKQTQPKKTFTLSTTFRLGNQILQALESIHQVGFLHRDIKPSNFSIGLCLNRKVFMLDFGLARQHLTTTGDVRPPRDVTAFRGTVHYASVNALNNKEMGRRDDIWSLFYMLIEFLTDKLPWKNVNDNKKVLRMKEYYNRHKSYKLLPSSLQLFFEYIQTLEYADRPDYKMLSNLLEECMKKEGVKETDLYDWETKF